MQLPTPPKGQTAICDLHVSPEHRTALRALIVAQVPGAFWPVGAPPRERTREILGANGVWVPVIGDPPVWSRGNSPGVTVAVALAGWDYQALTALVAGAYRGTHPWPLIVSTSGACWTGILTAVELVQTPGFPDSEKYYLIGENLDLVEESPVEKLS